MWTFYTPHPTKAIADWSLLCRGTALAFFCSGCRQHYSGVAMIKYLYSITKILREYCLLGSSVVCVNMCVWVRKMTKFERVTRLCWERLQTELSSCKHVCLGFFFFWQRWKKTEPLFLNKRIKKNLRIQQNHCLHYVMLNFFKIIRYKPHCKYMHITHNFFTVMCSRVHWVVLLARRSLKVMNESVSMSWKTFFFSFFDNWGTRES